MNKILYFAKRFIFLIIFNLKKILKIIKTFRLDYIRDSSLINIFKSIYYSYSFVDEWNNFPSIIFSGNCNFSIKKGNNARLIIGDKIVIVPWLSGTEKTSLTLNANSTMKIENEFVIGNGVRILVSNSATLFIRGKFIESASGVTAQSVILVQEYVEIGYDALIAWNTFITDSDWHDNGSRSATEKTIIEDHVWIGVGVKVLKGCIIPKNSIVGTNSVLVRFKGGENSLISGIPGVVVKSGISNWSRDIIIEKDKAII